MNLTKLFRRPEPVVSLPLVPEGRRLADERRALEAALKANEAATVAHFDKCWQEVGK